MRFLGWMEEAALRGDGERAAVRKRFTLAIDGRRRAERIRRGSAPFLLAGSSGEALLEWNLARGASPSAADRWRALQSGDGVAVVTGQQPALFGGPLYTLYKLYTAIALAERLERESGRPALAVFWIVGDDSDFGEVASAWIPDSLARLHKVRDPSVPAGGTLVGRLPARRQIEALEADSDLPSRLFPNASFLAWLKDTGARETWSGFQAALLFKLVPGVPFLAVDGGSPALLQAQRGWLGETARLPLVDLLREGAEEARAAGFEPALDPELGRRALFLLRGDHRESSAGLSSGAENGEPDALVAPNVALRPVLQDACLPNVATVCGPSEIRYRAQLGPLYRRAGVPQPALWPRMGAVLAPDLDPQVRMHSGREEAGDGGASGEGDAMRRFYTEAVLDPEGFLDRLTERSVPGDLRDAIESARAELRARLGELEGPLASYDSSLAQLLESAAGKADYQIGRMVEGLIHRARRALLRREPRLASWKEFVRPRGGEQERSLSLLAPYLFVGGEPAASVLRRMAEEHLRRLLEKGGPAGPGLCVLETGGAKEGT